MRANAPILDLAKRLLDHEAGDVQDDAALIAASERGFEKLRIHLSKRVGRDGFSTLITRAMILALTPFPHLRSVHIGAGGSVAGLSSAGPYLGQEPESERALKENAEGVTCLLAHLLGLLVLFIGEDLTLRMISAVWPTFHPNYPDDLPGKPNDISSREEEKQ